MPQQESEPGESKSKPVNSGLKNTQNLGAKWICIIEVIHTAMRGALSKMNEIGKLSECGLCKKKFEKLITSHLIPKSAYNAIKDEIVIINGISNEAFQSNMQIMTPFLCKGCENLFSEKGEKILGNLWAKKKQLQIDRTNS